MKKTIATFLCAFLIWLTYAQDFSEKNHYITFGVSNLFNSKVKIRGNSPKLKSGSRYYSPELNIGHIYEFSKNWRLHSKLNVGVTPYSLSYGIFPPENSIFLQYGGLLANGYTNYQDSYYLSPEVSIQRKINLNEKHALFVGIGARSNFYFNNNFEHFIQSSYFISESNPEVEFLEATVNNKNLSAFNIAANLEFGYLLTLKNGNDLKFSLIYNHAFTKRLEGTWEFKNLNEENKGELFQRPSFFGFGIEYQLKLKKGKK